MVSKERAMKLKMTEYDEEFSDVHAEGSQVREVCGKGIGLGRGIRVWGKQEEWASLMVSKERAMKLKVTEYD